MVPFPGSIRAEGEADFMDRQIANGAASDTAPGMDGRWPRRLRLTARILFAAALVSMGFVIYRRRQTQQAPPPPLRVAPLALDWTRELFQPWTSVEDGIALEYPARFEPVRGFGRFTSRKVAGGLVEEDLVAFRSMAPRGVIVVALYRAPRPLTWEEWRKLVLADRGAPPPAKPGAPTPFAAEFGGSDYIDRLTTAGDRPALAVQARGAVKYPIRGSETMELWQFESRLVAQDARAVRITAGIHSDQAASARPALQRTLNSFRWKPPSSR